jgi:formylglycine-generating enzyme required for sulfatase activity
MHFFISYAKKDTRALALGLAEALEAPPELTAWVDKELKATGSTWSRQIEREIQRCDYMIVLLSEDVNRSEDHPSGESFVLKEIEYMIQLKKDKRIIVVMTQDTLVPLMLTGKQYIDYRGGTDAEALADRLCDELGIARASDLRAAHAAQQAQADAAAHEREAQARRDAEARAERERVERARRDAAAAEARQRERDAQPVGTPFMASAPPPTAQARPVVPRQGLPWRALAIGSALIVLIGAIALVAWISSQLNDTGISVVPTPTTSSLPANAFTRQTNNAGWTPYSRDFGGIEMVLVPAGCFMMGSNDGRDDEQPVSEQCFDAPFWIDLTEVTQADFERLGGVKAGANSFDGDQRPVESITWFEARDFCAARGLRLPTEREWEYAARGPENLTYPWGNAWNENNAVWSGNSNNQTADVGSRPAGRSWVGALDMSGNVWEWVSSLYLPYDSQENREVDTEIRTDVQRVLRGGSWNNGNTDILRSANRFRNSPDGWIGSLGFRCARSS